MVGISAGHIWSEYSLNLHNNLVKYAEHHLAGYWESGLEGAVYVISIPFSLARIHSWSWTLLHGTGGPVVGRMEKDVIPGGRPIPEAALCH